MSKCNFLADKINCILCAVVTTKRSQFLSFLSSSFSLASPGLENYPWANRLTSIGTKPLFSLSGNETITNLGAPVQ